MQARTEAPLPRSEASTGWIIDYTKQHKGTGELQDAQAGATRCSSNQQAGQLVLQVQKTAPPLTVGGSWDLDTEGGGLDSLGQDAS